MDNVALLMLLSLVMYYNSSLSVEVLVFYLFCGGCKRTVTPSFTNKPVVCLVGMELIFFIAALLCFEFVMKTVMMVFVIAEQPLHSLDTFSV